MEEDNNEAGLLEALAAQGCCKLPSTIAHLRPQEEGTWCPSVTALQQRYLRRCGSEEATAVNGPASTSASVAETLPGGVSGWQLELAAELVITQAPAAITLAVPANHRLDPPFKISLHLASMVPLKAQVSVGACLVDSQEVASLSSWTPRGPGADNLLEGAEAQATIVLRESGHLSTDGGSIFSSSHEFVFPDLVFRHPTNMRPVWVVFYAALPCRDALLFTLFQVPTIVVADPSGADALTARRILWQGNPPEFPTPEELQAMSFRAFCARAREDIDEALSLTRTLLSDDLLVLAHSSGFFAEKTGGRGGDQFPTPRMRAEAVREYLKQTQALLRVVRFHYERSSPRVICSFRMGRTEAEQVLAGEIPGTFLFRFGRPAGSLVLSVKGREGRVQHTCYSFKTIMYVSLEEIAAMNNNAHFLIDPITKFRFPRELILNREYTDDPGVEALVIQRAYQRPPDGVHRLSMEVDGAEGPSARPEPGAPGRSCASVMSPAASALGAPAAEEVEQAPVQPEAQQLPAHPVPEEHQEGGEGEERMEGPCKRHRMDLARNDLAHALQMLLPRWAATAMRSSSSTLGSRQASDAIKCGSD